MKSAAAKTEFRTQIKAKIQKKASLQRGLCIYDKYCAKNIYTQIIKYKKPKAYKKRCGNKIFYIPSKTNRYNILLYMSLPTEVDITCIMQKLKRDKKYQVFVPKLKKTSFNMVEYRLPLVKNHWRIYEPKTCNIYKNILIDIAIVPVLGVDKNMKRIGFGKGMYDRFYETLKINPYSIFVSRLRHVSTESLCEWHDIQADKYVSTYK
ncbi:MAG: 5-formyltetrahydrofolate cyclo-ligase [Helicobacter trogontum]|uniref:5-formyltetrahydrofolate cyclo-ligase n=1 Tax=Helicobacter trogontum TaxID=50960 RepID=UPI0024301F85|nr:5-formyltetrahydrofolate cyclo-ligase [Helicobacter trogontum]MCI5787119.1 5-formyltetrahydrofolate cyclo-ligase [Helicobacter trogontum]